MYAETACEHYGLQAGGFQMGLFEGCPMSNAAEVGKKASKVEYIPYERSRDSTCCNL